ncbi:flagellar filament capping protein FliD, partial [Spirochaetota bacterium]
MRILYRKLRNAVMDAYVTGYKGELSLLSQIGITTGKYNSSESDIDRGKIEMNEELFNAMFDKMPDGIQGLFGYDKNGDSVIDTGCAYTVSTIVRSYIQPGGIIASSIDNNKRRLQQKDKEIEEEKEDIDDFRMEQQKKFSDVQNSQEELKRMQDWLNQQFQGK